MMVWSCAAGLAPPYLVEDAHPLQDGAVGRALEVDGLAAGAQLRRLLDDGDGAAVAVRASRRGRGRRCSRRRSGRRSSSGVLMPASVAGGADSPSTIASPHGPGLSAPAPVSAPRRGRYARGERLRPGVRPRRRSGDVRVAGHRRAAQRHRDAEQQRGASARPVSRAGPAWPSAARRGRCSAATGRAVARRGAVPAGRLAARPASASRPSAVRARARLGRRRRRRRGLQRRRGRRRGHARVTAPTGRPARAPARPPAACPAAPSRRSSPARR